MIVYIFLFGLIFASFFDALVYRIQKQIPYPEIFTQSSFCENCNKKLKWYELIPVLSYIFQMGKCSKCGKKIDPLYPISELFLGLVFVLLYKLGVSWPIWVLNTFLYILCIFDINSKKIPKIAVHIMLIVSAVIFIINTIFFRANSLVITFLPLIEALIWASLLYILSLIKKNSFGFGDILIILMLGLYLHFKGISSTMVMSLFVGGAISLILVAFDKKWLKRHVPFLPFIYIGFLITLISGNWILSLLTAGLIK